MKPRARPTKRVRDSTDAPRTFAEGAVAQLRVIQLADALGGVHDSRSICSRGSAGLLSASAGWETRDEATVHLTHSGGLALLILRQRRYQRVRSGPIE